MLLHQWHKICFGSKLWLLNVWSIRRLFLIMTIISNISLRLHQRCMESDSMCFLSELNRYCTFGRAKHRGPLSHRKPCLESCDLTLVFKGYSCLGHNKVWNSLILLTWTRQDIPPPPFRPPPPFLYTAGLYASSTLPQQRSPKTCVISTIFKSSYNVNWSHRNTATQL